MRIPWDVDCKSFELSVIIMSLARRYSRVPEIRIGQQSILLYAPLPCHSGSFQGLCETLLSRLLLVS